MEVPVVPPLASSQRQEYTKVRDLLKELAGARLDLVMGRLSGIGTGTVIVNDNV
jgi:hypothetical protein